MNYTLIPICAILVAVFLYLEHKELYTGAVMLKGAASLCFVVLGIVNYAGSLPSKLIVIGLLLGMVADVLLNLRYVFPAKGQMIFLIGILVFLSGHILYLAAILPSSKNWIVCAVLAVIATVFLMIWIFSKITAALPFKIFGVFYLGAVVFLNVTALVNLLFNFSLFSLFFMLGALAFLVSDIILILNTFGSQSKFSLRIANISLYYLGQLLIAFSLLYLK